MLGLETYKLALASCIDQMRIAASSSHPTDDFMAALNHAEMMLGLPSTK